MCHVTLTTLLSEDGFDVSRLGVATIIPQTHIASYLSKVADFNPHHLHLAPPQGLTPIEFRGVLRREKTRFPVLWCVVVCVILCLAVLVENRLVTDIHRHRQTDTGP